MTATTQTSPFPTVIHRLELGWRRTRPRASWSPIRRFGSVLRSRAVATAAGVATVSGRARGHRSIGLHIAAAGALDAGVWDLAGRGWALLAAAPLFLLLDLAAGDP